MIKSNVAFGIVPTDLLIVEAIKAALDDIRKNPNLLDWCFNWFLNDDLTKKVYGAKELMRPKEWFLKHEINVAPSIRLGDPKLPLVSVNLKNITEDDATLGDVNFDTQEEVPASEVSISPQISLGPFTPQEYDPTTGLVVLPDGETTSVLFAGMILVDTVNNVGYRIEDIVDTTSFKIEIGVNANFTNAYIAPMDSFMVAKIESIVFRHNYVINCFAANEPIYASYLHSIVKFAILRYKESLLERRGFDRTSINSTGIYQVKEFGTAEFVFSQDINMTGYVREYWPKLIDQKIQGIKLNGIEFIGGLVTPSPMLGDVEAQGWWSDVDDLPSE